MTIESKTATVYYAPTAGRRYLTKRAAVNAEARAIINKHWPPEPACRCSESRCGWCGDPGWNLEEDQPERFARYHKLLSAALKATIQ